MKNVREANINDFESIKHLEEEIFIKNIELWNDEAIQFAIKDDLYKTFIIEDKNDIIGYAILMVSDFEAYIAKFGISNEYRGNGYGEELLKYIINNINSEQIILEVRAKNKPAINLYKKLGFVEQGKREGMYEEPKDDALILIRKAEIC